jgi:polyhydroxybutyrate depolymerase
MTIRGNRSGGGRPQGSPLQRYGTADANSTLADAQNFIAVYPQGLIEPGTDKPFWAEIGPIDFGDDDVLFVSNILDDLQKNYCVDAHRIYATGFSNGGGMTTLLA